MKNPKTKVVNCQSCDFAKDEPFQDPEDKDLTRIYCKARHVNVDMEMMSKYCDFFKHTPNNMES
jgi:hypothetical protein